MKSLFSHFHRIEFAETDMAGIAHFCYYFRWMAACEEAFFSHLNIPLISKNSNLLQGWPRIEVECKFKAPLRLGETVEIQLNISELQEKWIKYQFQFLKPKNKKEKLLVAEGSMKTIFIQIDVLKDTLKACAIEKKIYKILKKAITAP